MRAGAYSIEAANARHEHEWRVWENVKLPAGTILIPGVVTHHTTTVEHPRLVADRIVTFAKLIGRENMIARTAASPDRASLRPVPARRAEFHGLANSAAYLSHWTCQPT